MMKELKEQMKEAGNLKEELERVREMKENREEAASFTADCSPLLSLLCC